MLDKLIRFPRGTNREEISLSPCEIALRSRDKLRRLKVFPKEDTLVNNCKNSEEILESLIWRITF